MLRTTRSLGVVHLALIATCALPIVSAPARAFAQTADELAAARQLFSDALHDQDQKHFDVALEKFRRVQAVRDTAPVRYRIGSCLEGLGSLAQATAAYQSAVDAGQSDRGQDDVVRGSRARIEALARRVPRVALSLAGRSPSDVDLRIDDHRIAPETLKEAIPLDPGEHVITATASGSKPFRTVVFLPEGGVAAVTIPLDPDPSAVAGAAQAHEGPTDAQPSPAKGAGDASGSPHAASARSSQRTAGAVIFAGGAVVAASGLVVYIVRAQAVSTLEDACPGGHCPLSRKAELDATRSRALTFGPVAAVLGIAGVAGLGIGSYVFLSAPKQDASAARPQARIAPLLSPGTAGLVISGAF